MTFFIWHSLALLASLIVAFGMGYITGKKTVHTGDLSQHRKHSAKYEDLCM